MANEASQRESIIVENQLAIGRSPDEARIGELDVVSTGDSVVSIISGNSSISIINFGDSVSNDGSLEFDHTDSSFRTKFGGTVQLTVDSSGITIAGNLTVSGTTTTVDTTNLDVTDNIILVNDGEVGAGVTLGSAGLEVDRGASTNAQWLFDESADSWGPANFTATIANDTFITSGTTTLGNTPPTVNNHLARKDYVDTEITAAIGAAVPAGIDERIVRYDGVNSVQTSSATINDTGQFLGFAGALTTPTYSFTGDPNTGMWNSSANVITFSTAGFSQLIISETTIDGEGNTLTDIADPSAGSHVGDRDFNDGRYIAISTQDETIQDIVGAMINTQNGIAVTYDDGAGKLNFDVEDPLITIDGDVDGSATMTNLGNVTITTTIVDDSHSHDTQYFTEAEADARFLRLDQSTAPDTNVSFDLGSSSFKWNNVFATTFNGQATSALYADLAERYAADMDLEPGTVVVFGGELEITMSTKRRDTAVAGVISTNPAYMMDSEAGTDKTHPYVALKGKVPCKVEGKIKKGDLIVTSDVPGHGKSTGSNAPAYTAFARSLEDCDGGTTTIMVSVI